MTTLEQRERGYDARGDWRDARGNLYEQPGGLFTGDPAAAPLPPLGRAISELQPEEYEKYYKPARYTATGTGLEGVREVRYSKPRAPAAPEPEAPPPPPLEAILKVAERVVATAPKQEVELDAVKLLLSSTQDDVGAEERALRGDGTPRSSTVAHRQQRKAALRELSERYEAGDRNEQEVAILRLVAHRCAVRDGSVGGCTRVLRALLGRPAARPRWEPIAEEGTKGAAWALEMGSLAEVWASEGRGKALLLTVRVASEALAQAGAEDDDQVAEPLEMFGQKLQLTAAALLATVPDREAVISTRNGRDAVAAAVRGGCKFFVARPAVQAALYDEWVGAAAGEQKATWVSYLVAPFIVVLNVVVFLPLVALLPPLDDVLYDHLGGNPRRARRREVAAAFAAFDTDGSGKIELRELPKALDALGAGPDGKPAGVANAVRRRLDDYDRDLSRDLDLREFERLVDELHPRALAPRPRRRLYILRAPLFKFVWVAGFHLALAVVITVMPSPRDADGWAAAAPPFNDRRVAEATLCGWAAVGLWEEIRQIMGGFRVWWVDWLNPIQLLSLVLATTAFAVSIDASSDDGSIADTGLASAVNPLLGVSVCCMYLAQCLRLVSIVDAFGPFVLMIRFMLWDILKWALLQLTANVAFGVALQQVFKDESLAVTESSDDFPGGDPDDCMAVYVSLGGSTMWRSLILLWEIVLGGDLHLGCLRESVHSYVATALMYAYLIISVVLLLNMLIAMMGATYQRVAEAAAENRKLQFAQYVVCWRGRSVPPPFTLLSVPFNTLCLVLDLYRACAGAGAKSRVGPDGAARGAVVGKDLLRGPSARVGLTEWARAVAPEDDFGAASDGEWRGWWWGTAKRRRRLAKFVDDYHAAHEHEIVRDRLGSTLEQLSEMLLGVERRLKDQVFGIIGEQLDAAVEAKVGSASRDMWELREEMKHVMSGALAEHLRGLSATDREDDLVEKVAKFVGAMETRVVEELQGHVSATVANRLHSFVTPVDDQLEQLRALVMQSAKLHDVDAALERLHSLIALHGVTGALPSGKASLSAVGSVDARVTALEASLHEMGGQLKAVESHVSNVVRDEVRALRETMRAEMRQAGGGKGGDGEKRITLVRMEDSYATRAPARTGATVGFEAPYVADERLQPIAPASGRAAVRGKSPARGRSPVREMAASVGGATSNAAANLMAAANRGQAWSTANLDPTYVAAPAPATPAARPASASRARSPGGAGRRSPAPAPITACAMCGTSGRRTPTGRSPAAARPASATRQSSAGKSLYRR